MTHRTSWSLGSEIAPRSIDWNAVADAFCAAWTSDEGRPDFETLSQFYAQDADIVIFDTLPPLEGFSGFDDLRLSIYQELESLAVRRTGDVLAKSLASGAVVATAYPFHLSYRFADGRSYEIDARITETWERRGDTYLIVQEHPSTVYGGNVSQSQTK